jgi:hypothetical protein
MHLTTKQIGMDSTYINIMTTRYLDSTKLESTPMAIVITDLVNLEFQVISIRAWMAEVCHCIARNSNYGLIVAVLYNSLLDLGVYKYIKPRPSRKCIPRIRDLFLVQTGCNNE